MSNKAYYYKIEVYNYHNFDYLDRLIIDVPTTITQDYIDYNNIDLTFKSSVLTNLQLLGKVGVVTDNCNTVYYIGRIIMADNNIVTLKEYRAGLDMPIRTDTPFTGTIETYLKSLITNNYITTTDNFKKISNLIITTSTSTTGVFNWENLQHNLEDIIQLAFERFNIKLKYDFNLNTRELTINISATDITPKELCTDNSDVNIDFNIKSIIGTTKCIFYKRIFTETTVDEITGDHTEKKVGGEKLGERYLKNDNSITDDIDDVERVEYVDEKIIDIDPDMEDIDTAARNAMNLKNKNHEIKIRVNKNTKLYDLSTFEVGSYINLKSGGINISSIITSISYEATNLFIEYTLGIQRIKLTSILKQVIKDNLKGGD